MAINSLAYLIFNLQATMALNCFCFCHFCFKVPIFSGSSPNPAAYSGVSVSWTKRNLKVLDLAIKYSYNYLHDGAKDRFVCLLL